jgi:hypothetical protein
MTGRETLKMFGQLRGIPANDLVSISVMMGLLFSRTSAPGNLTLVDPNFFK